MNFFISFIALVVICIFLQKSTFLNEKHKKHILMVLFIISFILCLYKIYLDFICNKGEVVTDIPKKKEKIKPKKIEKFNTRIIKKNQPIKINKKEHFSNSNSDKELLFFHADWCGHCQNFKPEWEKTKKMLDDKHISYKEINSENPEIKKYNIRGFPTLMMTNKNETEGEEYMGPREAKSVCKFAENSILKNKNRKKKRRKRRGRSPVNLGKAKGFNIQQGGKYKTLHECLLNKNAVELKECLNSLKQHENFDEVAKIEVSSIKPIVLLRTLEKYGFKKNNNGVESTSQWLQNRNNKFENNNDSKRMFKYMQHMVNRVNSHRSLFNQDFDISNKSFKNNNLANNIDNSSKLYLLFVNLSFA